MKHCFEKILERDMDFLILQNFICNPSVADLYLRQLGIGQYTILSTHHSLKTYDGESDIVLVLDMNGKKFAVFIEDKINAITMEEQSNRYTIRAKKMVESGEIDDYAIFISAPSSYFEQHKNDINAQYEHFVSYENILEAIKRSPNILSEYHIAMLEYALHEKEQRYVLNKDEAVTLFWKDFHSYVKERFKNLQLLGDKNRDRGAESTWVRFQSPHNGVQLIYKSNHSCVDLQIPKHILSLDKFYVAVGDLLDDEMMLRDTASNVIIRIYRENYEIDFMEDFDLHKDDVNEICYSVKRLYDFANNLKPYWIK